jgi:hypothetical protein
MYRHWNRSVLRLLVKIAGFVSCRLALFLFFEFLAAERKSQSSGAAQVRTGIANRLTMSAMVLLSKGRADSILLTLATSTGKS